MLGAICPKRLPLFKEKELHYASHIKIVEHVRVRLLQRHRIAMRQFAGPTVPAFELEMGAQTIEENEVVKPPLVLPAKALVTRARVWRSRLHEVVGCFKQQWQLPVENRRVVDGLETAGQSVDPSAVNPAAIGEPLQADQQWIAREGRGGGIGRVSVTERSERQYLPQTLLRRGEKIRERIRRRTKVADPTARRQRGRVKQNSAGARE